LGGFLAGGFTLISGGGLVILRPPLGMFYILGGEISYILLKIYFQSI
jgi:hypothetical protein